MNETLLRALVQARLSEEDVAANLQVDPKTVRRWLEGRTPYLRHRWALVALLGLDEADIWPQLGTGRSRPEEVRAIYPHSGSIPRKVWQEFFRSARQGINVLADSKPFPADDQGTLAILRDRAEAGIRVRVCLHAPDSSETKQALISINDTLARRKQSGHNSPVEIRLHHITLHNTIYRADAELIIGQRAFAIPPSVAPALHLRENDTSEVVATYLESFDSAWADSEPITEAANHHLLDL